MNEAAIERCILVGLAATRAAGRREVERLRRRCGVLSVLRHRWPADLDRSGLSSGLIDALVEESAFDRGERAIAAATACGSTWSLDGDDDHPPRLADLANPPIALCVRGASLGTLDRVVAVVGSRRCSRYARDTAQALGRDLAAAGIVVASGLARGVDAAAHAGALDSGMRGATIAVLGCGVDCVYPPEHDRLAAEIITAGGAIVSEFAPGTPPLPAHFPRRNRILAALAEAVVLVEATEKSGGLITVRWAADLGREVFVVPGQVDNPNAAGPLALVRDGVRVLRDARDLIADMGWDVPAATSGGRQRVAVRLGRDEDRLLEVLDHEPMGIDRILAALGESPGRVLTLLMSLELKGCVEQLPGLSFRRLTRREPTDRIDPSDSTKP